MSKVGEKYGRMYPHGQDCSCDSCKVNRQGSFVTEQMRMEYQAIKKEEEKANKPIEPLIVFAIGAPVLLSVGWAREPVHATILQVCISSGPRIEYEVVWWSESGTRNAVWVEALEVKPLEKDWVSEQTHIGFHKE